ncbi:fosfomycin resistance glutathione transferase [Microbulbifer sp. ZKSA002]|uniref:fosfomycin resistance glutathione transferase n=1 Tax=Microbulbifer sp. ZKSA002 TaxID=3243388 RepID=UPI00403913B7
MLTGLNHITLAVSDVDRSAQFYMGILGFSGQVKWNSGAYLSLNDLWLCLSLSTPEPRNVYTHIAFNISESNFERFAGLLKEHNVKEWKKNSSEGNSMYILDPDGHQLEIHAGSLRSRLESLKSKPYQGLKWL